MEWPVIIIIIWYSIRKRVYKIIQNIIYTSPHLICRIKALIFIRFDGINISLKNPSRAKNKVYTKNWYNRVIGVNVHLDLQRTNSTEGKQWE